MYEFLICGLEQITWSLKPCCAYVVHTAILGNTLFLFCGFICSANMCPLLKYFCESFDINKFPVITLLHSLNIMIHIQHICTHIHVYQINGEVQSQLSGVNNLMYPITILQYAQLMEFFLSLEEQVVHQRVPLQSLSSTILIRELGTHCTMSLE